MKKILLSLIAVATLFSACEKKFNDQFEGLDDLSDPSNLAEYSYVLTDADYTTICNEALKVATTEEDSTKAYSIKNNQFFSAAVTLSDYVALLLDEKYRAGDIQSSANITYNYGQNSPPFNILNTDDYKYVWGSTSLYVKALTPATAPDIKMDAILKNKFPDAKEGELKYIEYNYSDAEPISGLTEFEYLFDDFESHTTPLYDPVSDNGWMQKDLVGDSEYFELRNYSGNNYAQMSSFGSGETNDVYLINEVDLTQGIAPEFTFDVKVRFYNGVVLQVLISEDFDGNTNNIETATWTDITDDFTIPTVETSAPEPAGTSDLTAYIGKNIYVAFRYSGQDGGITTTMQLDNIKISEIKDGLNILSSDKKYLAYNFDGTDWVELSSETFYVLQTEDYDEMGEDSFSESDLDNYLPTFLKNKYPYAQEGDSENIVYETSSGSTNAMQFVFSNGVWSSTSFLMEKTEQYIFNGTTWVFDPSVAFTLQEEDYQAIVDYVTSNTALNYCLDENHPENTEYYYGASSYYKNFNFKLSYRQQYDADNFPETISKDAALEIMNERIIEAINMILEKNYPAAVTTVNGADVYYTARYKVYDGDNKYYTHTYQCTATGKFTHNGEDPIEVE